MHGVTHSSSLRGLALEVLYILQDLLIQGSLSHNLGYLCAEALIQYQSFVKHADILGGPISAKQELSGRDVSQRTVRLPSMLPPSPWVGRLPTHSKSCACTRRSADALPAGLYMLFLARSLIVEPRSSHVLEFWV